MNSFHELISALYKNELYTFTEKAAYVAKHIIGESKNSFIGNMRNAIVFNMPFDKEIPDIDLKGIPFGGMPYDQMWVEMQTGNGSKFGAYGKVDDTKETDIETWFVFYKGKNGPWVFLYDLTVNKQINDGNILVKLNDDAKHLDEAEAIIRYIYSIFIVCRCKNVKLIENTPSKLKQKLAKKKHKVPLYSDWTLHVTGGEKHSTVRGGTHASPRVHLRRGHIREYKPGQWTWVQPCVVGHGPGIVTKDYAMH